MKRKIAALVVFIAIAVMSISGTMAYFTADSTATNVITSGTLGIELIELEKTDDGLKAFENKQGVMPGEVVSKIVIVRNTEDEAAYVRVKVDKIIILAGSQSGITAGNYVSCNYNTDYWTELDGYFYYNDPLGGGEETVPLFTEVTFSKEMGDEYQGCRAEISVVAEAVQVKNNKDTVFEAEGWPAE